MSSGYVLDSERTGKRGNGGHKKSTTTVVQVYSECPSLWGSKLNERAQANVCQTSAETLIDLQYVLCPCGKGRVNHVDLLRCSIRCNHNSGKFSSITPQFLSL